MNTQRVSSSGVDRCARHSTGESLPAATDRNDPAAEVNWMERQTDREPLQREGVHDAEREQVVTPKCLFNQEEVREAVRET